uniref:Uncharacterized protein n=1 Tax=Molossus molossus TaxID=27622 RepID=A0A7J8HHD7_MOLMO|nr:hypothetical protein HJG59_010929 [Molossus molossus]
MDASPTPLVGDARLGPGGAWGGRRELRCVSTGTWKAGILKVKRNHARLLPSHCPPFSHLLTLPSVGDMLVTQRRSVRHGPSPRGCSQPDRDADWIVTGAHVKRLKGGRAGPFPRRTGRVPRRRRHDQVKGWT